MYQLGSNQLVATRGRGKRICDFPIRVYISIADTHPYLSKILNIYLDNYVPL